MSINTYEMFDADKVRVSDCPWSTAHKNQSRDKDYLQIRPFGDGFYAMMCTECGAVGPMSYSVEEAVALWNNRTIVVLSTEQYERMQNEREGQEEGEEKVEKGRKESEKSVEEENKDTQKNKKKK